MTSNVLDNIFVPDVCGNAECEYPDEYPYFWGSLEMREFTGCQTDCGQVVTKRVTVNMFDPWKPRRRTTKLPTLSCTGGTAAMGSSMRTSTPDTIRLRRGWAICSRNPKEEGFFETVHVRWRRIHRGPSNGQTSLKTGSLFGGSLSFDLSGLWELRIAFSGFSWSYDGAEVPIAFPAVRGEICIEGNDGDDDMHDSAMECKVWDPCAAARNCSCEWWQDGTCYFFQPEYYGWEAPSRSTRWSRTLYLAEWPTNDTYVTRAP